MNSPYRVTETRSFGPTLETQSLPTLGQQRHIDRARAWQRIAYALAGFWFAVAIAIIAAIFL